RHLGGTGKNKLAAIVMAGHSASKTRDVLMSRPSTSCLDEKGVDAREKRGHDRGKAGMPPLNELSCTEIAEGITGGKFTVEAVTRDCLERIKARESTVQAWATVDPDHALAQARALDRGPRRGALHGVTIGVKDVIDTFDLPTEMGSPIYKGHPAACDAACVAVARAAGRVLP